MLGKKQALKGFAIYYLYEMEGDMKNWPDDEIREYLTGDIFVGAANAVTDIPEEEFIEFIVKNKLAFEGE